MTGKYVSLTGAAWAKTINIGSNNFISSEGVFSAQAPSVPPPCNDNNACTVDACVGGGTSIGMCRNTPSPSGTSCEDGNVCNGAEQCDGAGRCQSGTNLSEGTSCADNNACNGDETCSGFGTCLAGTPQEVYDGNACTTDSCDPATGVSNLPVPDGTTCSGIGTCQAGVCSVIEPAACVGGASCTIDLSGCTEDQKALAWRGQSTLQGTLEFAGYTHHNNWVCQTSIPQAWPVIPEPDWWCGTVVNQCTCSPTDGCN